jgi:hypothetical protein
MNRLVALVFTVLAAAVFSSMPGADKKYPPVGTWTLNVGMSKASTGSLPKTATRTVEAQSDGEKTSYQEVEGDGSRMTYTYSANYDGKDYPISGSGPASWRDDLLSGAETVSVRPAGSNAFAATLKKSDKVVMTTRMVVSKDGKVLTITANGADAKGQPTSSVTVWNRQ